MSKPTTKEPKIRNQATVVVTLMDNGVLYIRSHGKGKNFASKLADAIVKLSGSILKNADKLKGDEGDK